MNIAVLMGSPRKKDSFKACLQIEETMKEMDKSVIFDFIFLKDYRIEDCKGCSICFQKSESQCPCAKDDLNTLKQRLISSDGIIVAAPVYAYQVPAPLKRVIDRLSYLFHRQEMIAKPALIVVTTDGGGSKTVYKYLKMTLSGWGLDVVGNVQIISPMYFENRETGGAWGYDKWYFEKNRGKIIKLSTKFIGTVAMRGQKTPSFYDIFMFHCLRSKTFTSKADYNFWLEKGWIKSDYFYDVKLNLFKKLFSKGLRGLITIAGARYLKK